MGLGQTSSSGGLGGAVGGLVMVASLLIAMRKAPPGPVGRLIAAGAVSAETALKPATAKITRRHELQSALERGLVIELEDGRCWVDVPRVKRRRRLIAIGVAVATGITAELVYLGLRSAHLL